MKLNTEQKLACKSIEKDLDLLKTEIAIHKKLIHENIVKFVSSLEDESNLFIVMELCQNSLSEYLEAQVFVEYNECRSIVRQILSGADYLHKNGIIHRDLKLSNVLIKGNKFKICDFGLAIHTNAPSFDLRARCGTVMYMPPEIVDYRGAVTKSDIWSKASG